MVHAYGGGVAGGALRHVERSPLRNTALRALVGLSVLLGATWAQGGGTGQDAEVCVWDLGDPDAQCAWGASARLASALVESLSPGDAPVLTAGPAPDLTELWQLRLTTGVGLVSPARQEQLLVQLTDASSSSRGEAACLVALLAPADAEPTEALLNALRSEQDPRARAWEAVALQRWAASEASGPLQDSLDTTDSVARAFVAAALAESGEAGAPGLPSLIRMAARELRDTPESPARNGVLSACQALGAYAHLCLDEVMELAAHGAPEERLMALTALEKCGVRVYPAAPALLAIATDHDVNRVERSLAISTLGATAWYRDDIGIRECLRGMYGREEGEIRLECARALARSGDASGLPALADSLGGEDRSQVLDTVSAVGPLGMSGTPLVPALAALLSHNDYYVRAGAAEALYELSDWSARAAAELIACATDDAGDPAYYAALALATQGDERVLPLLEARLASTDVRRRCEGAFGLRCLAPHSPAARARLTELLADSVHTVATYAAIGLAETGDGSGRELAAAAAGDAASPGPYRHLAASALAKLGDQRGIDALRGMLADGDPVVRRNAEATLAELEAQQRK